MTADRHNAELRRAIVERDKRFVWHPYTPMRRYIDEVDPFVVERAEGSWLFDFDGRRYLDGNSSWYVAALGHNHPRLVRALTEQAKRLCHVSLAGTTHEGAARLAEEMIAIAPPGMSKIFYSDDGSTAVEVALKMALQFAHDRGERKRTRFVALEGAYHGDTIGAASLGGEEEFRRPYASVLLECVHVPFPKDARAYEAAFEAIERILRDEGDTIAAVVLEPLLQGTAGMRVYDASLFKKAREMCDRAGALLVVDEVFTGYGRVGAMWASAIAGVTPDLLATGKGFSGGMLPMAATLTTERIFDAFAAKRENTFWYGHSFTGNPLGAAVAREVLAVFRDEAVVERAQPKCARIASAFAKMGAIPGVARTRSIGMTGALDLAEDASYGGGVGWRVFEEARKRGAYLRPLGDTVYIAPPINIETADLDALLEIVEASVRAAL